jgi:nucleotide-binding universal stress UspA family protein
MFIEELPDWLRHMTRDPDVAAMAAAWQNEHDESVQAARHELRQFQHKLPSCFAGNEPLVVEGRPVEKLLAKLHEAPFDLVIAGSRGSGSVERMLVGSTSEQLLAMAPCSVLIVR